MVFYEEKEIEFKQGGYWRLRRERKVGSTHLPEGRVYMLKSIREVEGNVHTLILAGHPLDGKGVEYKFLVDDFVQWFDPISDDKANEIRNSEMANIQKKISAAQTLMIEASSNPTIVEEAIKPDLHDWEKSQGLSEGETEKIQVFDPAKVVFDQSLTPQVIAENRLGIMRMQRKAEAIAGWYEKQAGEITSLVHKLAPFIKERADAALAGTEDVRRMVKRLEAGVTTLDLYVLKDVHIQQLKAGASAPDTEPLTIQQMKLYTDEEMAVFEDPGHTYDIDSVEKFDDAIAKYPGLVDQIFVGKRGVVCMATTRQHKDYSKLNPREADELYSLNRQVFLMVRDGENVYKVISPVETHLRSNRLFPSLKEIDDIFKEEVGWWERDEGKEAKPITYMHLDYTDALEEHEHVALHYKRLLILLTGLDHHKELFGTFHARKGSMAFFDAKFQRDRFRFIHDDEELDVKRLPGNREHKLKDFIERNNGYLTSGSRVVVDWEDIITPDTAPTLVQVSRDRGGYGKGYWHRVKFIDKVGITVVNKDDKHLVVKTELKRDSHRSSKQFTATIKISEFRHNYYHEHCGFLVLDRVKSADLAFYIYNRHLRKDFTDYLRLFKHAMIHLRDEEAKQLPAEEALGRVLKVANIPDSRPYEEIIAEGIAIYRSANRGAEVPHPDQDPAAFKRLKETVLMIANESSLIASAKAYADSLGAEPLRVDLSGKGKLVLYVAPTKVQREDRLCPHAWVREIKLEVKRDGTLVEEEATWMDMPDKIASRKTLYVWAGAADWMDINVDVSYERKVELLKGIYSQIVPYWLIQNGPMDKQDWKHQFNNYKTERHFLSIGEKRRVQNPDYWLPVGLVCIKDKLEAYKFGVITIRTEVARILYAFAPDDESRAALTREYADYYRQDLVESKSKILTKEPVYNFSIFEAWEGIRAGIRRRELHEDFGNQFKRAGLVQNLPLALRSFWESKTRHDINYSVQRKEFDKEYQEHPMTVLFAPEVEKVIQWGLTDANLKEAILNAGKPTFIHNSVTTEEESEEELIPLGTEE